MAKVICLDLELNQPSGKIIQIGYVVADIAKDKILCKKSLIVDPMEPLGIISGLNVHISDYTGITQDRIDREGISLRDAFQIMLLDIIQFNPTKTCVQWGDGSGDNKGDHDHLRRELGLSWDEFVFRPRAWDVKSQFQIYRTFSNDSVVMGVGKALESLGMKFEGREHDALNDAINTLRIFVELGDKAVKYDKIKKLTS